MAAGEGEEQDPAEEDWLRGRARAAPCPGSQTDMSVCARAGRKPPTSLAALSLLKTLRPEVRPADILKGTLAPL